MKNKKGFTLVELLSAIVLLGIIITLGIFSVSSIRNTIIGDRGSEQYSNNWGCSYKMYVHKRIICFHHEDAGVSPRIVVLPTETPSIKSFTMIIIVKRWLGCC